MGNYMMFIAALVALALVALASCYLVHASDPEALQDSCVTDLDSNVKLNGAPCKDPKDLHEDDFFFSGLHMPADTSSPIGFKPTLVTAAQVPGLNTLGISMARLDFAPYGLNPPHIHPRATELAVVLEGTLEVGFLTSNPENRLISKVIQKGDVFVFPVGLVHYLQNKENAPAVVLIGLSSQNPGVIDIPVNVFASEPRINSDILAKAFQIDNSVVDELQSKLCSN